MKRITVIILCVVYALALCACGDKNKPEETAAAEPPAVTAQPDPYPPLPPEKPAVTDESSGEPEEGRAPVVTRISTPTPMPTATPVPTPEPLRPGTYTGTDGSVLKVNADGTCTYETELSGTVNGRPMTGRVTFHGTAQDGAFSFTRVTYFGLDLTEMARAAGYADAGPWEAAAAALYAGGAK